MKQDRTLGEEYIEKIIHINRNAKVVKGGRRFSFSALVVVGDGKGNVGIEMGKAAEVPEAIRKATEKARKNMWTVPLRAGTIAHEITGTHSSSRVLLKPASPGTGVIAGGPVRAILEAAGVQDILSKCFGSRNPHNVVKAVTQGLRELEFPEEVAQRLGKVLDPLQADGAKEGVSPDA